MDGWAWVGEAGEGGGNWGRSHAKVSGCAKHSFLLLTLLFFIVHVCLECVKDSVQVLQDWRRSRRDTADAPTHTSLHTDTHLPHPP